MDKLVSIIDQLKSDSSRTGKEQILKDHADNKLFRGVLRFVYNPFIVTGISAKKMKKKLDAVEDTQIKSIADMMKYLHQFNSGRDVDIANVQTFIKRLPKEHQKLATEIATKSLKIGVTSNTINKIYGVGEIESFDVMLAESFAKKEAKVTGDFYVTLKLDGNRCIAIREGDKVSFFTRSGKAIEGMVELEEEFLHMPSGYAFDGEILLRNDDNLPSDELFRATQTVVRKDGEKRDLEFHAFDIIQLDQFKSGKSLEVYMQRRVRLENFFLHFQTEEFTFNNLKCLPVLYKGSDKGQIAKLMVWAEINGYEGLMVNTSMGHYVNKRSSDLLKVKKFHSADLLCVAVEEGTGRNEGRLGALLVEYKGGITKVGSGFTDAEREEFWADKDAIVNKIVEVQYFEESKDSKTKQVSLRFPVFKTIRNDKTVEDIRYE